MEMHQIRYFLAVCSERNFTRAAKALPRLPTVADARHQTPRSRARRPPVPPRASAFAPHRARRDRPASSATSLGTELCGHHTGARVHRRRPLEAQDRHHVHDRAALLTDLLTRMRNRHQAIGLEIVDGSARDLEEQLVGGHIAAAIYGAGRTGRTPASTGFRYFANE